LQNDHRLPKSKGPERESNMNINFIRNFQNTSLSTKLVSALLAVIVISLGAVTQPVKVEDVLDASFVQK
jgi:hypothetical protein